MGWRRDSEKVWQFVDQDKDSLIRKVKTTATTRNNKQKQLMCNSIAYHPPIIAQPIHEQWQPSPQPEVLLFSVIPTFWSILVSCPGSFPPSLLCSYSSSLAGQCEQLKSPWFSLSTVLQQLEYCCVINIIFLLNLNNAPYQPLWRKLTLFKLKGE